MNTTMYWLNQIFGAILFFIAAMGWILLVLFGVLIVFEVIPYLFTFFPYSTFN